MKIITTSWDDGFKSCLKLADILKEYSLGATFYVPVNAVERKEVLDIESEEPFLNKKELRKLNEKFEIGAHGVTHSYLTSLSKEEAKEEIKNSKVILEELTERNIKGFAYPVGKYNRQIMNIVKESDFFYARTTEDGCLFPSKRYEMPASIFCSNSFVSRIKFTILSPFSKVYAIGGDWTECIFKAYQNLKKEGGVLHIAGHPQNLSRKGYKQKIENVFSKISGDNEIEYLTNYQTAKRLKGEGYLE